jgi:hypothetical protein
MGKVVTWIQNQSLARGGAQEVTSIVDVEI